MSKVPRISETEWAVMKVAWAQGPVSAADIIAALQSGDESWHPKTAKTLLNRLVRKKALGFKKDGRSYLYFPLASESECVRVVSESFLERVFGGGLKPMLAHFVGQKKLSDTEIKELKKLLEKRK